MFLLAFHNMQAWISSVKRLKAKYEFDAIIGPVEEKGGAFVRVLINLRAEFVKGRLKVHALFDGAHYDGSVVSMGVKNEDGSICYIIGVRKDIQKQMGKGFGDIIHVILCPILQHKWLRKT